MVHFVIAHMLNARRRAFVSQPLVVTSSRQFAQSVSATQFANSVQQFCLRQSPQSPPRTSQLPDPPAPPAPPVPTVTVTPALDDEVAGPTPELVLALLLVFAEEVAEEVAEELAPPTPAAPLGFETFELQLIAAAAPATAAKRK
jgi:hypothetical protein